MSFRVNVDKPTKLARIHTVNSDYRRCQPRKKKPKDGWWILRLDTRQGAIESAEETGLHIRLCKLCKP